MSTSELLILLNPWWKEGLVREDLARPYRRNVFFEVIEALGLRQIQVLTGLRRVGKSTIMYQAIDWLIREGGVDPQKILYFSFDLRSMNLLDILKAYSRLGVNWRNERVYLFLDEVQKVESWPSWLKILYDSHPNLKIVVSGSSSLHLEEEARKNLAGRYILHKVEPLSLIEFFELKTGKVVNNPDLWREELSSALEEYLKKPFPEIVNWSDLRAFEYVKESVVERVAKSDLGPYLDQTRAMELLTLFYQEPGQYLNVASLSGELGMSKKTLYKYISYLESSYLIRTLRNYRPSFRASSRKMKRVYPYHWSLLFGVAWPDRGPLIESVVASLINASHYWREGRREVDFVLPERLLPVEVKAREGIRGRDLDNLIYFMGKFGVKEGVIVHTGEDGTVKVDGLEVKALSLLSLCVHGLPLNRTS